MSEEPISPRRIFREMRRRRYPRDYAERIIEMWGRRSLDDVNEFINELKDKRLVETEGDRMAVKSILRGTYYPGLAGVGL